MRPAGTETLSRWREAGEWWKGGPDIEVHRFIDQRGVRRETVTPVVETGTSIPSARGDAVLLHALSAYSRGGTMIAAQIPALAAEKGYGAVLLADRFSLSGAREFCRAAQEAGVRPMVGVTVELAEGGDLVLVATCPDGYRSLSRLVTECCLGEPRTYPLASWDRLARHTDGVLCLTGGSNGPVDLLVARKEYGSAKKCIDRLVSLYGRESVVVQVERTSLPWQPHVGRLLHQLADKTGVTCVAGGPVLTAERAHYPAHDILVCVDTLCKVEEVEGRKPARDPTQPQVRGLPRRSLNRERHMRHSSEAVSVYADEPCLIDESRRIADRCDSDVLPGRVELPQFCADEDTALRQVVEHGAWCRYGALSRQQKARVRRELDRMVKLGWSRHFLIAWEMCEWARGEGILFSGRGSVVDSMVAYCLGISRIDAFEFNLHFDRFLPPDGGKRPDIDIDFEASRREDVRQHLVRRYGDDHVATVAAVGTYRTRGIVREVGKVMGIPESHLSYLSKRLHGGVSPERLVMALDSRPELRDSDIPRERYHWVFEFAERLADLPRNMRAHSSGVVVSKSPVADTVPVQLSGADGVKIMQWDKRSAKHSFDKFDLLCLRGNDVLGGTMRRVDGLDVCDLPLDDDGVYRAMRSGQLVGVPQSASPAMRQAHIRIGTRNLKDAGIVQAGIRPGVGGAVKLNEFIARRQGKPFVFVHPDLEVILGPTLGIVVFQEQIDQLLEKFGGYTGDEAEEIREAVQKHHDRHRDGQVCEDVVARIVARGYSRQVAQEVHALVSGFKGYGFAEGHALAFAEVSVRSIYCQQNYPSQYFAALLDAQPAGYYGPATLCNEARVRGVQVLQPDVNKSEAGFSVEDVKATEDPKIMVPAGGVRVPLRQIAGLSVATVDRSLRGRPYHSFFDFVVRVRPEKDELRNLVHAGAFDSLTPHRRALLWMVDHALGLARSPVTEDCLPLQFEDPPLPLEIDDFNVVERAVAERRLMGLDVARHLMAFERDRVTARGGLTAAEASCLTTTEPVFVVGNPIRLRFPPTESGRRVLFFDLEDETGLLNVTCFDDVYQRDGHKVVCHPFVTVRGVAQNRDGHIAFMARRIYPYRPNISEASSSVPMPLTIGDFLMR
ncbi:MAG: DNA polymerase III subunit alpha [Fimbriimonadaceae bacterium]|nr:DNA polymerase III subunit alpha [Fimbriimonadaceae bacterium]